MRTAKPWYRKQTQCWYVWHDGRQVNLGPDRTEADRRYHQLLGGVQPAGGCTVARAAGDYLRSLRLTATPLRVAEWMVHDFTAAHGRCDVERVGGEDVERWAASHRSWGRATRCLAITRVRALLAFAGRTVHVHRPPIPSRGRQAVVQPSDVARLLEHAYPALRDVLIALHDTGARPSEVLRVTAREYDVPACCWVLVRHKTDHTGRVRIVHLSERVVQLCNRLAAEHPSGPLFCNSRGEPWNAASVYSRVSELCDVLGVPRVTPYGFRHTFATDLLAAGVPDAVVAELLGHRGTATLHHHYAHLLARAGVLREALRQAR